MARRKSLVLLLDDLRVEARLSSNPAHNVQVRESHVRMLQREQERLWGEFDWPHLMVDRYIPINAGQRYYDPVTAYDQDGDVKNDMTIDRISSISFKTDGEWAPIGFGIDRSHYAAHDSFLDAQAWPVQRWRITEDDMIEVWPVPDQDADEDDQNGYLKITGIRKLRPLVNDNDEADLDDNMLVLFVAGDILAAAGAKDAQLKIEKANRLFMRRKGALSKTRGFSMFGIGNDLRPRRPMISRYRAPGS